MKQKKAIPFFYPILILSFAILLVGCGGGGGNDTNVENPPTSTGRVTVSGYVYDIDGNPVDNAKVTISSDPITVFTDADGHFSANIEAGPHEIIITKGALTIYSSTFNCGGNEPLDLDSISTSYDPNNQDDDDGDGYASDDCDDGDPSINPGETETPYNGKDDDCNPVTLDDDLDQDGFLKYSDCDDGNSSVNPSASEICDDTIDNDCDVDIDYLDSDCEGYPSYPGNVMYFEPERGMRTTELNGKVFDQGFTFSGWFNFTQVPAGNGDIMGFSYGDFWITIQDSNIVNIQLIDKRNDFIELVNKKWNNLAVTYDLFNIKFYLNGALVENTNTSGTVNFEDGEDSIFNFGGFYGYATQIKIWNRGLSYEELIYEINQANSSNSEGIEHQWLLNEGTGIKVFDSVGGVDLHFTNLNWVDLDGPYEIDHDSILKITAENKLLPMPISFGSADFNQDGHQDLFYQGAFHWEPIFETPMLVLQNDGTGKFRDASDSLVEGGYYYKRFPAGRETIVADLNKDGYSDIFIGQSGQHGDVEGSEANTLLLSHDNSGKLYPSEDTIMSPPCTLTEPEYNGQKPCSSDTKGNIYYPNTVAPLVPIDINSNNHGSSSGDIDNDGDTDIFIGAFNPCEKEPVQPYFLINDGNGNFIANWQMVPNKAFHTEDYLGDNSLPSDKLYVIWHLEDFDRDGFLDLLMLSGSPPYLEEHQPLNQFDVEQDNWDESVHELIAWGTNGGFSENYTILEEDPVFVTINNTVLATDIDMDGDIDIVVTRQNSMDSGQYLHVYANNGNRTFSDVTQQSIPQNREIAHTLNGPGGEMREIDFNDDGCPDFYAQSSFFDLILSEKPHLMWLNNCKGYFTPIENRFIGRMGLLIPLDADGDGDIDFVSQTSEHDENDYFISLEHTLLKRTRDINMDKYIDTDRDGFRDIDDNDDDNDGINDSEDAFPKDQFQS